MSEIETQVVNRWKFGMNMSEIQRELKISYKTVRSICRKYGLLQDVMDKCESKFPQELLRQWDMLHERYGTIPKQLLEEWDMVTGRLRTCQR